MDTHEVSIQETLMDVLDEAQGEDMFPEVKRIRTFEEAGILTNNMGLVLTMRDGSEYQLDIVRSR